MAKTNRYANMTQEDFDRILEETIEQEGAITLLQIPGVYELLAEYYNNEVLAAWTAEQDDQLPEFDNYQE